MKRKKKLRIIQFFLLTIAILIIFFTYYRTDQNLNNIIVDRENIEKVKLDLLEKNSDKKNLFYDVEYSGLDLEGNRYILKSKEAFSETDNQSLVYMNSVEAFFYFKDNTILKVKSKKGEYNNETLDMNFFGNVEANYENSKMYASQASYSNLNGFLTISNNVKIEDIKGNLSADKLIFDIKKKKLDITSFNNSNINGNINLE
tara:strand:+ start:1589 stop:2194 length:606 start_codon:yes stop_codon:yes gene_type:complete